MPDRPDHGEYLGDGVYVSFDGYQLWLAEGHHEHRVIALEPEVFNKLVAYSKRIYRRKTNET